MAVTSWLSIACPLTVSGMEIFNGGTHQGWSLHRGVQQGIRDG